MRNLIHLASSRIPKSAENQNSSLLSQPTKALIQSPKIECPPVSIPKSCLHTAHLALVHFSHRKLVLASQVFAFLYYNVCWLGCCCCWRSRRRARVPLRRVFINKPAACAALSVSTISTHVAASPQQHTRRASAVSSCAALGGPPVYSCYACVCVYRFVPTPQTLTIPSFSRLYTQRDSSASSSLYIWGRVMF